MKELLATITFLAVVTACVQEQTLKAANEVSCLAQQAIDEVRWRN